MKETQGRKKSLKCFGVRCTHVQVRDHLDATMFSSETRHNRLHDDKGRLTVAIRFKKPFLAIQFQICSVSSTFSA